MKIAYQIATLIELRIGHVAQSFMSVCESSPCVIREMCPPSQEFGRRVLALLVKEGFGAIRAYYCSYFEAAL